MFCFKCGRNLPEDSEFCFACGTKVAAEVKQPLPRPASQEAGASGDSGTAITHGIDPADQPRRSGLVAADAQPNSNKRVNGDEHSNAKTRPAWVTALAFVAGLAVAAFVTFITAVINMTQSSVADFVDHQFDGWTWVIYHLFPVGLGAVVGLWFLKFRGAFAAGLLIVLAVVSVGRVATYQRGLANLIARAAQCGHNKAVTDLISAGAPVDRDAEVLTVRGVWPLKPVVAALGCEQFDIAIALVNAGAKVEPETLLQAATSSTSNLRCVLPPDDQLPAMRDRLVIFALERGANPNINSDPPYGSILSWAYANSKDDVVNALVRRGAKVETEDQNSESLIIRAIHDRRVDTLKALTQKGLSAPCLKKALYEAQSQRCTDCLDVLQGTAIRDAR